MPRLSDAHQANYHHAGKIRDSSGDNVPEDWPASLKLAEDAVLIVSSLAQMQGELLPGEDQLLVGARPARRREIIAGRRMAHHAMSALEVVPAAIMMDYHGAPIWPSGLCGSIAHSPQHIAIALSRTGNIQSLGIDIEDGRDLAGAMAEIASDADIAAMQAAGFAQDQAVAARMVFSAKEALFKCQAPVTGNNALEFGEIGLRSDCGGPLIAQFLPPDASRSMACLQTVRIYFYQLQGVTTAIAAMEASPALFV